MQAGNLRHRLKIQKPVHTQDQTTGHIKTTWQDVCTVWGEVTYLSAREMLAAQAVTSKVVARIKIRYRQGVKADMRILHGNEIFNIEGSLPDHKTGREYITLPCSEGLNDG